VNEYAKFLKNQNQSVNVLINNSADLEVRELLSKYETKFILNSLSYGHSRSTNKLVFLIHSTVKQIIGLIKFFFKSQRIVEPLIKIISKIYTYNAIKYMRYLSKTNQEINLLLPSLDAQGLRFIEQAIGDDSINLCKISVRIIGSEKRGPFAVKNGLERLSNLCTRFPQKINIGYEVKILEQILINKGINKKNIFWAPIPSNLLTNFENSSISHEKINLGFLGGARKNKGFETIPEIINALKLNNIEFKAYVQKPNFMWDGVQDVIQKLESMPAEQILILDASLSRESLEKLIGDMDILILPYDSSYSESGSGLLYIASDFRIPIATNYHVAFGWDVSKFKIGMVYKDFEDLSLNLLSFSKRNYFNEIGYYNEQRNLVNLKFLDLMTSESYKP